MSAWWYHEIFSFDKICFAYLKLQQVGVHVTVIILFRNKLHNISKAFFALLIDDFLKTLNEETLE